MKKSELKQIIKEEIDNTVFNLMLQNYTLLKEKAQGFLQWQFVTMLHKHVLNLLDIYESEKVQSLYGYGYSFFDKTKRRHFDGYYEARKRLFLNLINQFTDRVQDIDMNNNHFIVYLKQKE